MAPSLMAHSLSKLLITAALFYYKLTWAQDFCGHIGDDNNITTELRVNTATDSMFYLHNSARSGNITSWKMCYYVPTNSSDNELYNIEYAVYRRNGTHSCYIKKVFSDLSFTFTFNITLNGCSENGLRQIMRCCNKHLETPFAVQNDDIIAACVHGIPDHEDSKMIRIDIFNRVVGQSIMNSDAQTELHRFHYIDSCQRNTSLPATIDLNQFSSVKLRMLHLFNNSTGERRWPPHKNICAISTAETITGMAVTSVESPPARNATRKRESQALNKIMESRIFRNVCNLNASNDSLVLDYLKNFTKEAVRESEVNLSAPIYLLSSIINGFEGRRVKPAVTKLLLTVSSSLLDIAQTDKESRLEVLEPPLGIAGSTLLRVMDRFAQNNHNISHPFAANLSQNIAFHIKEVTMDNIADKLSFNEDARAKISIPREVLEGAIGEVPIRLASFLYRNMTGLLPESLNENDVNQEDRVLRLASPVISASCENCTTSNLSTPVEITFTHLPYDQDLLKNDANGTITCVFWDFEDDDLENPESILFTGQWSIEGCNTNFTSDSTMCQCDHLTHFAILLSARPLDISREQTLALQITGYIGVSVSLVAMAVTIFVFVFLKPLRTMRNYIHIQLCVTLGIAQIIFVAGVEPRLGEGSGVPIGCRSVAVLLHYWFLVSFMWMLMEGVVLYVALVRVFIKFHGRYIAAFTIASYGLPLLYVGALTVPLGFVRTDIYRKNHSYDYGYEQTCYLNPDTSFVWSLIAPVILIFLANIGFFIMAIVIMYRHQKRQNINNKKHKFKHWLKASISLTVVMGITWIIGFLVIEVEELFALAYIFTIFVAFQGLFIFVIFVLLSKQVRENYAKWWKAKVAESDFLSKRFGSKIVTSGTGLSVQNRDIPLPPKMSGQSSESGISSKVFENSCEEHKHRSTMEL